MKNTHSSIAIIFKNKRITRFILFCVDCSTAIIAKNSPQINVYAQVTI